MLAYFQEEGKKKKNNKTTEVTRIYTEKNTAYIFIFLKESISLTFLPTQTSVDQLLNLKKKIINNKCSSRARFRYWIWNVGATKERQTPTFSYLAALGSPMHPTPSTSSSAFLTHLQGNGPKYSLNAGKNKLQRKCFRTIAMGFIFLF